MNTPVQGGASECMLYALIRLNKAFTVNKIDAKLVNCVHDEVLVECKPRDSGIVALHIAASMQDGFLDVFPKGIIKGITESKVGITWGDAK